MVGFNVLEVWWGGVYRCVQRGALEMSPSWKAKSAIRPAIAEDSIAHRVSRYHMVFHEQIVAATLEG